MSEVAERFEYDEKTGKFDDIFLKGRDIHIEALGSGEYFIGIYTPDGQHQIALNANKARVAWISEPLQLPPDAVPEQH